MSGQPLKWLLIACGAAAFIMGAALFFYINGTGLEKVEDAYLMYQQGEIANSATARRTAFNHSLNRYHEMESSNEPTQGTGKLYYNIGNSYFQLEEYPMAILYYHKAKKLRPSDPRIDFNLSLAEKKLGVPIKKIDSIFDTMLAFNNSISLPERTQFLAYSLLLIFLFWSAEIWIGWRPFKVLAILMVAISLVLFVSLFTTAFFEPVQGVLVKGSDLYRDAGTQYAKVIEEILPAGETVRIRDISPDGNWYKIETPDKKMGYVPETAIRLI